MNTLKYFLKDASKSQKAILIFASILVISMVTLLITMATFNTPVADQLDYIYYTEKNGVIGNTVRMYNLIGGRLFQFLAIGISYRLFNPFLAQIVIPIFLLITLGLSFTWLFHLLFKKGVQLWQSFLIGFLLSCTTLYTIYCLFDIYLWLDAALVYLLGIIMIVLDTAIFIWLTKQKNPLYKNWKLYPLLFIAVIGQTAGETSMILILGWSFIIFLSTVIIKKWHIYRKAASIMLIALLVGSIIMLVAPGLWNRADHLSSSKQLNLDILILYPAKALADLFSSIKIWQISLVLLNIIIIGSITAPRIKPKKHFHLKLILLGFLIALSFSYVSFVTYCYINQTDNIEARVKTMASLGVFIGVTLIGLSIYYILFNKTKYPFQISASIIIITTFCFTEGFISFNQSYLSVMSTRRNAYITRDSYIKKQLSNNANKLEVIDIPVMIKRSNASDFTANNWVTIDWFYDSYRAYYGFKEQKLLVTGLKLINNNNQPDWYNDTITPPICVPANDNIDDRYWCETAY